MKTIKIYVGYLINFIAFILFTGTETSLIFLIPIVFLIFFALLFNKEKKSSIVVETIIHTIIFLMAIIFIAGYPLF